MKLKVDDNGNVVLSEDGKPIYVHDDGKEIPFDAPMAFEKIKSLGEEAKSWRLKYEKTDKVAKKFEGIEDPEEAMKALEVMKNLDQKKLIDAGEVEKVKAEVQKAMQAKIDERDELIKQKDSVLQKELIGGRFARSKFIQDKLAIPPDLVEARFGSAYKIEDGKVIAYDHLGNQIFSKERPGELADFDEALGTLVDQYPYKDSILKGSTATGPGVQGSTGRTTTDNSLEAQLAKAQERGDVAAMISLKRHISEQQNKQP